MTFVELRTEVRALPRPLLREALLAALEVIEACEDYATNKDDGAKPPTKELDAFFAIVTP